MQRMGITDENQAPASDSFREGAEKRVRLGLLLSQIIKDNEIELDKDRITAKVDDLCEPYDNPDEIRNIYLQNPQFLGQIENMVLEEQVVEWLSEQAQIKTKSMGFKELMELSA
jgi:trigger factor